MAKYPTMLDWIKSGAININVHKKEDQHKIIKEAGLPFLEIDVIDGAYFGSSIFKSKVDSFLSKTKPVVFISSPKEENLPKDMIDFVMNWTQIEQFISKIENPKHYNFLITEMVVGTPDGYTGVAVSDGNGKAVIEFYVREKWTDPRTLSSGCSEKRYHDISLIENSKIKILPKQVPSEDAFNIFSKIKNKKGYFEFIKGTKNNYKSIYFMEFQDDPAFLKVLNLF